MDEQTQNEIDELRVRCYLLEQRLAKAEESIEALSRSVHTISEIFRSLKDTITVLINTIKKLV